MNIKRFLSVILVLAMLAGFSTALAANEGDKRVTIGADLSADEIAAVYKIFGVNRGDVEELSAEEALEKAVALVNAERYGK